MLSVTKIRLLISGIILLAVLTGIGLIYWKVYWHPAVTCYTCDVPFNCNYTQTVTCRGGPGCEYFREIYSNGLIRDWRIGCTPPEVGTNTFHYELTAEKRPLARRRESHCTTAGRYDHCLCYEDRCNEPDALKKLPVW